jgi:AcrR family transcriptional regulator
MKAGVIRRRLQPQARRTEIIEAAERVLRLRGTAAGVQDVVDEAGTARGTFYLYFPTWDALILELRRRIFNEFDRHHAAALAAAGGDWPGLMDRLAVAFVDFTLQLGGLHKAVFHGPATLAASATLDTAIVRIEALLRAGSKAGGLAVADPASTARLLFAVLHETVDAIEGGADHERAIAAMRQLLRRGVALVRPA